MSGVDGVLADLSEELHVLFELVHKVGMDLVPGRVDGGQEGDRIHLVQSVEHALPQIGTR